MELQIWRIWWRNQELEAPFPISVMNRRSSPWVRRVDLRRKESRTGSYGLREESRRRS